MDAVWKLRDLEYTVIPELQRNIRYLESAIKELREKVSDGQINNGALAERIFALEEKERQLAREDHDREQALDEPEDKGQCSVCNIFYSYEDLYVVDTKPSDDYYDIEEIYECKYCKKEGRE